MNVTKAIVFDRVLSQEEKLSQSQFKRKLDIIPHYVIEHLWGDT